MLTIPRWKKLAVVAGLATIWIVQAAADPRTDEKSIQVPPDVQLLTVPQGLALADTAGRPLFVFSGDRDARSHCIGECLVHWLPFVPPHGALDTGEWTVLKREDGSRQWAFRKQPLYLPDEIPAPDSFSADSRWHQALYSSNPIPPGIRLTHIATGPVFVTEDGMSLYVLKIPRIIYKPATSADSAQPGKVKESVIPCLTDCLALWHPLAPRRKQGSLGNWSLVKRADGKLQWAYKGQPVYTYAQDRSPGDRLGELMRLRDRSSGIWRLAEP